MVQTSFWRALAIFPLSLLVQECVIDLYSMKEPLLQTIELPILHDIAFNRCPSDDCRGCYLGNVKDEFEEGSLKHTIHCTISKETFKFEIFHAAVAVKKVQQIAHKAAREELASLF